MNFCEQINFDVLKFKILEVKNKVKFQTFTT